VKARIWSHNRNKRPPRVVGDVQAASIPAARGIVSREKSAVRPFSIEFDLIGCDRPPVALTRYPLRVKLKLKGALKFLSLTNPRITNPRIRNPRSRNPRWTARKALAIVDA